MAKNNKGVMTGEAVTYQIPAPAGSVQMETFIPWTLVKRGVRQQVITPIDAPEHFQLEAILERSARKQAKDSPLIRALGLAHYWQRLLDEDKYRSLTEITAIERIDLGQASRTAQLTRLAPEIIESCMSGGHLDVKIEQLARVCFTGSWVEQRATLKSRHVRHPTCPDTRRHDGEIQP